MDSEPGELLGYLDLVCADLIEGWAFDPAHPDDPVPLRILDNGRVIAELLADGHRPGLMEAGFGNGFNAFSFEQPNILSPRMRHVIQVQRATDWQDIPNSPWTLEAVEELLPTSLPVTVAVVRDETCQGFLDTATRQGVEGWAIDSTDRDTPMALALFDNGVKIADVLANRYRADLDEAGVRNGRQAFKISIPGGLSPLTQHVIQVKRVRDGADIPGSPVVIEPSDSFDDGMEQMVANAIEALEGDDANGRAVKFMVGQLDRLLQRRADTEGQRAERLAHKLFRRRWGPQAAEMSAVTDPGLRALVIDNRVPERSRDAGSHVILSHMTALDTLGYRVSLVAADEMALAGPAVDTLAADGFTVCGTPFYGSAEDVLRRQASCFDVIYIHRPENAARYLTLARKYNPRARILYSVADLHHVRLARQAKVESRPELAAAAERMRMTEYMAAWSANAVITHSIDEAGMLRQALPKAQINVVTWAVAPRPTAIPFAERKGVAFVGGYSHWPNPDAAHWLIEAVMPLVWQADPEIPCLLIGAEMPESLRRLADDRVLAIGHVADLAEEVFDRVRLTVAPLRFGAGVKGKVLESFAAGVPCVMSPIAAEGLALAPALQSLVGRNAAALAGLIHSLHSDENANRNATEAGLDLIRRDFNADVTLSALKDAIDGNPTEAPVVAVAV